MHDLMRQAVSSTGMKNHPVRKRSPSKVVSTGPNLPHTIRYGKRLGLGNSGDSVNSSG